MLYSTKREKEKQLQVEISSRINLQKLIEEIVTNGN